MITAAEARKHTIEIIENNKINNEQSKTTILETVDKIVQEAINNESSSVCVHLKNPKWTDIIMNNVYSTLAEAGFDVVVINSKEQHSFLFMLYWAKDRGGTGNISYTQLIEPEKIVE